MNVLAKKPYHVTMTCYGQFKHATQAPHLSKALDLGGSADNTFQEIVTGAINIESRTGYPN